MDSTTINLLRDERHARLHVRFRCAALNDPLVHAGYLGPFRFFSFLFHFSPFAFFRLFRLFRQVNADPLNQMRLVSLLQRWKSADLLAARG